MPSTLYTSGPALWYVALPELKANVAGASVSGDKLLTEQRKLVFLGTCEAPPIFEERKGYKDVYNDLMGSEVPFDVLATGVEVWVGGTLNKYKHDVYRALTALPYQSAGNPGLRPSGSIGTLQLQENMAPWLCISFPYQSKHPNYVPGYLFKGAIFMGPHKHTIGTTPHTIQCVWRCLPVYSANLNVFQTYTNVLPVLPQAD